MKTFINSHMTMADLIAALFDKAGMAGVAAMTKLPSGEKAAYTLLADKNDIEDCVPYFPAMPANAARAVSKFTREASPLKEVAVFLRPCELRALTELVKIKQACLDNLFIISFDCGGVFPVSEINLSDEAKLKKYRDAVSTGKNCKEIRPVCSACTRFVPEGADMTISFIGRNMDDPLVLCFPSEKGKTMAKALCLDLSNNVEASGALESLAEERKNTEGELTKRIEENLSGTDGLLAMLDKCISCHACSYVCPICYCKNCYFDSQTFEYFPESFFARMEEKGGLRFPVDRILFHLGRLSHMSLSCVACGMCEDACPVNIPVAQIFKTAGTKAQTLFDYVPGKDIDEPLPLLTYAETELEQFED